MKLLVKLKSTVLMWSTTIPNSVIGDPSAVFNLVVVACIGIFKLLPIVWYVEYLMRDMAAPESMRALYHFPACTVIVGQSVMSDPVMWSFEGSSSSSWESLLGEGSTNLKDLSHLPGHWGDHQSCNKQCVDLQSSPFCSSWDVVFFSSCCSINLISEIHALKICRMVLNVIYCGFRINNLKSFNVGMICDVTSVVCQGEVCGCVLCGLSKIFMSCSCSGCIYPGVVI